MVTPEVEHVARAEQVPVEAIRDELALGKLVIPANIHHVELEPMGIGMSLRCKINANIGNSQVTGNASTELEKLRVSIECGADTVMDLSTGGDIDGIRRAIIEAASCLRGLSWPSGASGARRMMKPLTFSGHVSVMYMMGDSEWVQ